MFSFDSWCFPRLTYINCIIELDVLTYIEEAIESTFSPLQWDWTYQLCKINYTDWNIATILCYSRTISLNSTSNTPVENRCSSFLFIRPLHLDLLKRHHPVQSSKNSFFHVFSLRIAFPKNQLNKRNTKLSYSYTVYNWIYHRRQVRSIPRPLRHVSFRFFAPKVIYVKHFCVKLCL